MSGADYLPPDAMTLGAAGETLSACLSVIERGERETDRTYYDTFDGLLYSDGLSVVHEHGRLALIERDTGVEQATLQTPPPTQPMLPMKLAAGALRDALVPIVEVRALLPLVHVHSRVHGIDVLDAERKTVVRMTLEQPAAVTSSSSHRPLRPRVRLAGVRGYDDELAAVQRTLEDELHFKRAEEPLIDEAVRAVGGVPGGVPSKISVPLAPDQRADAATVAILRALLRVIEANVDGTLADIDAEFLHDFRVAVRRSRAVQREMKGVFPPAALAAFRAEFKWLQTISGDSRDLDVYVLEFDATRELVPAAMQPELDPLLDVLRGAPARGPARDGQGAALRPDAGRAQRVGGVPGRARRAGRRGSARRDAADRRGGRGPDPAGLPADGEDGRGDHAGQSRRGLPRAAQEGQGASLPARAVTARRCSRPTSSSR